MKQILTFFTFLIFSTLAFAQENIPYTSYVIIESFSNIEFKDASEGVHVSKSPIKKDGKNKTLVRVLVQNKGNDWKDVSLKVERLGQSEEWNVSGRGELHLSILIENMRREGYELQVSKPEVVIKEIDGINQVRVKPLHLGAGTVKVIVSNDNDIVSEEVLQNCIDYIENVRPIGANVTVITPSALEISVKANIEVKNGYDDIKVKLEFENNLIEYLKTCNSEVTYTKVASCLGKVEGIEDYNSLLVNGNTGNISFNDEQIPKLKSIELEVI